MTQETRTQKACTPVPDSDELTASELAQVAGGTKGAPSNPGTRTAWWTAGKPPLS